MDKVNTINISIVLATGEDAEVWAGRVGDLIARLDHARRFRWQFWRRRYTWWDVISSGITTEELEDVKIEEG